MLNYRVNEQNELLNYRVNEQNLLNYRVNEQNEKVPRYKVITKDQNGTSYHLSMVFLYLIDFTWKPGGMGPYSERFRHELLYGDPSFGTEWTPSMLPCSRLGVLFVESSSAFYWHSKDKIVALHTAP